MFTYKALVVGDGTAIMRFDFPTNNVKFNDAVSLYDCNAIVSLKGLQ
jgi:hypothetical protein